MPDCDKYLNLMDVREGARKRLPRAIFDFIDRGVEDEKARGNARHAFDSIKLRRRVMVDVSERSIATTLLGVPVAMPVAIAPTGAAGLCWFEGELTMAKAAAAAGIPFTLTSASFTNMERIAKEAGGRIWFQFYLARDRELSYELVQRADTAGLEALVVTVDTPISPNREHNTRNGFSIPFRMNPTFVADVLRHPGWLAGVMGRYVTGPGLPRFENYPKSQQRSILAKSGSHRTRNDSMTWDDLKRIRDRWPRKLIAKGILCAEDAELALGAGADAIIVSTHGGRLLDSTPASIEVLPEIVAAVGDRTTVMLDSGIMRGSDVIKALALGAKTVLIGRSALFGVSAAGGPGIAHVLKLLHSEIDRVMAFIGCTDVATLDQRFIEQPQGSWPRNHD